MVLKGIYLVDLFRVHHLDPFNLELRPLMTEAIFSLIVRKIRSSWKTKPTVGCCTFLRKNKYIYTRRDLLTKKIMMDRNIFKKRYIEICLINVRHVLDNYAKVAYLKTLNLDPTVQGDISYLLFS